MSWSCFVPKYVSHNYTFHINYKLANSLAYANSQCAYMYITADMFKNIN